MNIKNFQAGTYKQEYKYLMIKFFDFSHEGATHTSLGQRPRIMCRYDVKP